jgi:hypothetical protein
MAEAAGALYGVKNVLEGAALLAKGIYDPTLPLKATLKPVPGVELLRAYHSLSIIKGRAYIFGGRTAGGDNDGQQLADNDMHVVILPFSGVEGADYKRVEATSEAPPRRYGHRASVIGDRIYIFGGKTDGEDPVDEEGRVWIYDTVWNKWLYADPPKGSPRPDPRYRHASVASEHPKPRQKKPDPSILPQAPPDPEKTLPNIPSPDTYGTVIIQGGIGKDGTPLNDMWTFDIASKTWVELPEPNSSASGQPSLALVGRRLYCYSRAQTSYLDLTHSSFNDMSGSGELGLAPSGPWQTIPHALDTDSATHPGERWGASMTHVTTGQGRHYLLLIGGLSTANQPFEDIWALQLRPEGMTAASFKDAARLALKKSTGEAEWQEVRYYSAEGVALEEGQVGRGIGGRIGFASAEATEIDGASVMLWGGVARDGKVLSDGLVVSVDR